MEFLRVGWQEAADMCKELAGKVSADYEPDIIVGISRGGLVPARILSDELHLRDLYIIKIEFYKDIAKTADFPEVKQSLPEGVLEGKKVLLVDDVSDTGRSLAVAKDHVKRLGAADVRIAVLHEKPQTITKPDYVIGSTKAWVVYPWEVSETEKKTGKKVSEL